jgi:uncharacterized membrane protein
VAPQEVADRPPAVAGARTAGDLRSAVIMILLLAMTITVTVLMTVRSCA